MTSTERPIAAVELQAPVAAPWPAVLTLVSVDGRAPARPVTRAVTDDSTTPIPALITRINQIGTPAFLQKNGVTPDRLREYEKALEQQAVLWGLLATRPTAMTPAEWARFRADAEHVTRSLQFRQRHLTLIRGGAL